MSMSHRNFIVKKAFHHPLFLTLNQNESMTLIDLPFFERIQCSSRPVFVLSVIKKKSLSLNPHISYRSPAETGKLGWMLR